MDSRVLFAVVSDAEQFALTSRGPGPRHVPLFEREVDAHAFVDEMEERQIRKAGIRATYRIAPVRLVEATGDGAPRS